MTSTFDRLLALETFGIKLGLENIARLCQALGHPERAFRSLHIAGTNGKGSVTAMTHAALRAAGVRAARYTSPHLSDLTERFVIGDRPVETGLLESVVEEVLACADDLRRAGDLPVQPTFFEATTAAAFELFRRAGTDVAVIEVGLGGRLDATNVVVPEVAVVTHVTVDHVDYLGSDPAGIAREKAGIAKPGVPFLTAEPDDALFAVLSEAATAAGAQVRRMADRPEIVDHDMGGTLLRAGTAWGAIEARLPLAGTHQATNALLALRALELTGLRDSLDAAAVRAGVEATRWPGRFQVERVGAATWIFDVAHNPAAIERLAGTLREMGLESPVTVLLGVMGDKDWAGMIAQLGSVADHLVLTRPAHAPSGRAWDPAAAAGHAAGLGLHVRVDEDLAAAVRALRGSSRGTVVVTGSFHTVGEALDALPIDLGWAPDPPVDPAVHPVLQR